MVRVVEVPPQLPSPRRGRPRRRRLQLPRAPPRRFESAVELQRELWEPGLAASTLAVVGAWGRCEVREFPLSPLWRQVRELPAACWPSAHDVLEALHHGFGFEYHWSCLRLLGDEFRELGTRRHKGVPI